MLRLPGRVEVRLTDLSGERLNAAGILIGLNVLLDGRYYYGNLVGLTDQRGSTSIARSEIDLRFAADRALYPIDYKVQLEDCDSQVELILLSEAELAEASRAVAANPGISADIREQYAAARNRLFAPALVRFWADLPQQAAVVLTIPTHSLVRRGQADLGLLPT